MTTLAAILDKHYPAGNRCFLKLDIQGSEKEVLEGGQEVPNRIVAMKIEMSLVQNYEGEALLPEMLPYLYKQGFRAVFFENGWRNSQTGELYQVDSILCRNRNCVSAGE